MKHNYRVIISIPETDEWEKQEMVDSMIFDDEQRARAYGNSLNLSKYPQGTTTYVEYRPWSEWKRL